MKCFPDKEEAEKTLSTMFVDALSETIFTAIQFCHYSGLRIDSIAYSIGKAVAAIYHHVAEQSDKNSRMSKEDRFNFLRLIREGLTQGFTDYIDRHEEHQDLQPRRRINEPEEN